MKNMIVLLFVLGVTANSIYSQTKGIPAELADRTWKRTVETPPAVYSFVFKNDSSFTFTNPANDVLITLKFKLENDVITFPATGCPEEGKYKFTVAKNELTISLLDDNCKDRSDAITGIWKAAEEIIKEENR
jgi:hypothetical protein